ncbi:MAG: F0F1 ATP synthase subunit A [Muribaculaceae bacterium]|nr:F0F1 ATP synthase subunit A [Muribaculaceae bacterium]
MKKLLTILSILLVILIAPATVSANEGNEGGKINPKEIIFDHLGDHYGWEVPFMHSVRIPLPVIVKDKEGSWHIFSSSRLMHDAEYEGFAIAKDGQYAKKIVQISTQPDGTKTEYRPLDLSITKNVMALIISALVVMLCAFSVLRWYKKHNMKAPHKATAMLEVVVEFVYYGVIRPTLGAKAHRFAPYLLTVFFFILVMNLLGLIVIFPGGANLTGNIAVTMVLAVCTFIVTNLFGTKHYWKDIFWPDVPLWLKFPIPIMPVIEIFGMFTKPAALMVRLFANMMGGHMIVITLTLLIFIFAAFGVAVTGISTVLSVAFSLFMLLLDTLVSFIQAYVFTMLSTLFISLAQEEGHHEEKTEKLETK